MKGLFIPEMTVEKFRNECFESVEALIAEDEIFNIDYDPRHIPAIRDKLWEIQQCSNCILKPEKKIVEIKPQWTSVTEGMPEEDKEVLITYKGKGDGLDKPYSNIDITTYGQMYFGGNKVGNYKHWRSPFLYFHDNYEVTAWMSLPEPYEETSE